MAGQDPARIPVVHENPMETSALPTPDSYTFFSEWEAKSPWKNDVTVKRCDKRSISRLPPTRTPAINTNNSVDLLRANHPATAIHRISPTPLLMTIASADVLTPTDLALEAYARAREPKQLHLLPDAGHFDGYSGRFFDKNAGVQTEFLRRTLCARWEEKIAAK